MPCTKSQPYADLPQLFFSVESWWFSRTVGCCLLSLRLEVSCRLCVVNQGLRKAGFQAAAAVAMNETMRRLKHFFFFVKVVMCNFQGNKKRNAELLVVLARKMFPYYSF